MGLSIHYSGAFNQAESLSKMIEEVKDIAKVYQWHYHIFNDAFAKEDLGKVEYSQDVFGINFTPTNCETVSLIFLSNGRMSSLVNLQAFGLSSQKKEQDYLYMVFAKTQYAGIEIHKLLIHLFKYLSKKYLYSQNYKAMNRNSNFRDTLRLIHTAKK